MNNRTQTIRIGLFFLLAITMRLSVKLDLFNSKKETEIQE